MNKKIFILVMVAVWGVIIGGSYALINYEFDQYHMRQDLNCRINIYESKLLISQEEYSELKTYLAMPDVDIKKLDVYESEDVLIDYRITSPVEKPIPLLGEPASQDWLFHNRLDLFPILLATTFLTVIGVITTIACYIKLPKDLQEFNQP